jgi:tRNA(Ile)-lysidine synthetase-like protein
MGTMTKTEVTARDPRLIRETVRRALGVRDRSVLAVSGGVDSMVLLHAAAHTVGPRRIVVATFDHGTGPYATAARDHVVRWCERAGVACVSERATTALTTEAAFRDARWGFLRRVAARHGGEVATAHTADDQIETVLMRILRGAGARGIAGLLAESEIARPLLGFSRREIADYATRRGVEWVEDPSNLSRRFLRNRVRHELLPALMLARPSLANELRDLSVRAAAWRADVDHFVSLELESRVLPNRRGLDVPSKRLRDLPPAGLAVLWPAVAALAGVTLDRRAIARLVEFTMSGAVGSRAQIAGGWDVVRSRDALQLRASGQVAPGETVLLQSAGIHWGDWAIHPSDAVGADAWSAWLPSDGPLTVRQWRAGDVLAGPRGGGRQRKVKHLLSKAGVTGHERAAWPVVLSGGEIIWVPGVGRSDAATVRSGRPVRAFACEHNR